jgi:hypothetical protein
VIQRYATSDEGIDFAFDDDEVHFTLALVAEDDLVKLEESEDHYAASVGRFAHENSGLRSSARKNHEARRRLENAIRRHTTRQCGCRTDRQCLAALARLIPVNPRPAYKSRNAKKKVTHE